MRFLITDRYARLVRTGKIVLLFMSSGLLGMIVLESDYFACDMPGCVSEFVPRSSLLLPLFAGLFGLPTLILSLRERRTDRMEPAFGRKLSPVVERRVQALSLLGGFLVGWIPGMTSGSSATLCSSISRRPAEDATAVDDAVRFIWLYSAVSSAGAVLSVGALFSIMRARSGVMDAVVSLTSPEPFSSSVGSLLLPSAILLSMLLSALVSHIALMQLRSRLKAGTNRLCSKRLSICAALFVCGLVAFLTGMRGMLLLSASCSLGLVPPMIGVRRIHLMGCLLVPIALSFLSL
jgi:putative membrane protein